MGLLKGLRRLDDVVLGDLPTGRPSGYGPSRSDLRPGDRVRATAWSLRDQTGTLIRPTRLASGKHAWLVQMDNPKGLWRGRTRVADRYVDRLPTDL